MFGLRGRTFATLSSIGNFGWVTTHLTTVLGSGLRWDCALSLLLSYPVSKGLVTQQRFCLLLYVALPTLTLNIPVAMFNNYAANASTRRPETQEA